MNKLCASGSWHLTRLADLRKDRLLLILDTLGARLEQFWPWHGLAVLAAVVVYCGALVVGGW